MINIIAFHCVPYDVDPNVENFWILLSERLRLLGRNLILITTTEIYSNNIEYVQVPFKITEYHSLDCAATNTISNATEIKSIQNWYKCGFEEAVARLLVCENLFKKLFNELNPSAVISWQSANPISRLVRRLCLDMDLPWWCAERGWINDTLMLDLSENNRLSEVTTSFALNRIYYQYKSKPDLYENIKARLVKGKSTARYAEKKCTSEENIRKLYEIPAASKIFVLFTHGEPHLNALDNKLTINHSMDSDGLELKIKSIAHAISLNNDYLIIKEHPFNSLYDSEINMESFDCKNIIMSKLEGVDQLLFQGDYFLFTCSTIQFNAALMDKRFGLLSRGLLSGPDMAPFVDDFNSIEDFLNCIKNKNDWVKRNEEVKKMICFLFDYCLLDISPDNSSASSEELAKHLAIYN